MIFQSEEECFSNLKFSASLIRYEMDPQRNWLSLSPAVKQIFSAMAKEVNTFEAESEKKSRRRKFFVLLVVASAVAYGKIEID